MDQKPNKKTKFEIKAIPCIESAAGIGLKLDLEWNGLEDFMNCNLGECEIDATEDNVGDYDVDFVLTDDFNNEVSFQTTFKVQNALVEEETKGEESKGDEQDGEGKGEEGKGREDKGR